MAKRNVKLDSTWGGTVSSGTMRSEDLAPAFIDVLANVRKTLAAKYQSRWNRLLRDYSRADEYDRQVSVEQDMSELVNELFDELENVAPDGTYFGSHPGDGADYGFWPVDDDDTTD